MNRDILIVRAGDRLYGLSVACIEETMRPLPVQALPGVPAFVSGVSIVRGESIPVVLLRSLFGDADGDSPKRLVTLRSGERRVGLLVDEVLGIRDSGLLTGQTLPSLLQDASLEIVDHLRRLDDELLTVLHAGRVIPEEVWASVPTPGTGS
jgi:purine-binding chemotaxis protein CheW